MPVKPLPPCRQSGCPERALPDEGYCAEHLKIDKRHRFYGYSDPFYRSAAWVRARALVLRQEPACAHCGKPANVVDHIIPRTRGGLSLARSNLQALCEHCHNVKRQSEGNR